MNWSPDGQSLVTASFDGTAVVWDMSQGEPEPMPALEGHENEVKCAAWSTVRGVLPCCQAGQHYENYTHHLPPADTLLLQNPRLVGR